MTYLDKYSEELKHLYLNKYKLVDIAKMHNASYSTVFSAIAKLGLSRTPLKKTSVKHDLLYLRGEEIKRLYLSGIKTKALAEKYNVTSTHICTILHKEGLKLRGPRHMHNHIDEVVNEYKSGIKVKDIADKFGVTTGPIFRIVKKHDVKMRHKGGFVSKNGARWLGGGKPSQSTLGKTAYKKVKVAIKHGALIRQPCEVCGDFSYNKAGSCNIHAHHEDYSKPLEVIWLCAKHHYARHKEIYEVII